MGKAELPRGGLPRYHEGGKEASVPAEGAPSQGEGEEDHPPHGDVEHHIGEGGAQGEPARYAEEGVHRENAPRPDKEDHQGSEPEGRYSILDEVIPPPLQPPVIGGKEGFLHRSAGADPAAEDPPREERQEGGQAHKEKA